MTAAGESYVDCLLLQSMSSSSCTYPAPKERLSRVLWFIRSSFTRCRLCRTALYGYVCCLFKRKLIKYGGKTQRSNVSNSGLNPGLERAAATALYEQSTTTFCVSVLRENVHLSVKCNTFHDIQPVSPHHRLSDSLKCHRVLFPTLLGHLLPPAQLPDTPSDPLA